MHIALYSPGWPLSRFQNGIVTFVNAMRPEYEATGHRVSVFAGEIAASSEPRVYRVKPGPIGTFMRSHARRLFPVDREILGFGKLLAEALLAVHRREPIDIIEMEESFGWSSDVRRLTPIPVLVKLHGPAFLSLIEQELTTPRGRLRIENEGRALARAEAIASPSIDTLKQTLVRYKLDPPISAHIVNAMDVRNETPCWNLADCDRNTILFVGRFDRRKGADIVLQAFALLIVERPALRLVIVGPDYGLVGADGSSVGFEEYRDQTLSVDQRSRVEYRGKMSNRDIVELRLRAMVTIVASRWENQGYTLLEAMAHGCPVVCSDAGGSPESVIHDRTGMLARSADAADFAAKMASLLDDPGRAARLGAEARRHVIDIHSPAKVARDSLDLYRRVIERDRKGSG